MKKESRRLSLPLEKEDDYFSTNTTIFSFHLFFAALLFPKKIFLVFPFLLLFIIFYKFFYKLFIGLLFFSKDLFYPNTCSFLLTHTHFEA
jgi:hypothetical protein